MVYYTEVTYQNILANMKLGIQAEAKTFVSESEDGSNLVEISSVKGDRLTAKEGLLSFIGSNGKKEMKCVGKEFVIL